MDGSFPPLQVQVPIGANVVILAPGVKSAASDPPTILGLGLEWAKGESLLALPERSYDRLVIRSARPEDSGGYSLKTAGGRIVMSNVVAISVGDEPAFVNVSARLKLQVGEDTQVVGFVIGGKKPKTLLVRVLGDSLRPFGIERVVERPRFRLRNANGFEIFLSPRGTVRPSGYWESLFARVGAFPLFGSEAPVTGFDAGELHPGAYTIHVTDDSRKGGETIVEVYDVPPEM